ncbi:hypothetical protein G7Y89_g9778 [Cudoniella acicularis]|uniref:Uncharacterized protein n=1 Tax=Cudoniella acicularis TaxID=354080 RepID=A0A8H4RF04_9HELO|nr:hypothetical protein G7Y89_g9778 [Cudoniella acicularis]
MAYDQNYYQPPQRPYNGRAAQRPGPPQAYNQAPQQQYPPQQQYDEYGQDGYGYDEGYNDGYAQEYDDGYQQAMNGGGRGNGYPPQNQNYPPQQQQPPQQEYYGNDRGGRMPPRGGGRGAPMQRPPTADGQRGGYGGPGRGYPNGGPQGRGGRPAPLDRSASSDPGPHAAPRKPLKTPPISPDVPAWDNPFPTFPGAKKKTLISEEQKIIEKMASMEVGAPPPNRSRGKGSNGGRGVSTDDYGRPSLDGQRRPPPADDYGRHSADGQRRGPPEDYGGRSAEGQRRGPPQDYGRPSADSQRNMPPRNYPSQGPPQQGYPEPRRGPPGPGYGPPQQNGYGESGYDDRRGYGPGPTSPTRDNFGPPGRSMTMPNEAPMSMGRQPPMPPMPMEGPGPSAPYNGPIGRGAPPRPSTAGANRAPPQRNYQNQPLIDPYAQPRGQSQNPDYAPEVIDDVYDSYYDPPSNANGPPPQNGRPQSAESAMPNFDVLQTKPANHKRGGSIDEHIQGPAAPQNNYPQQLKPMKSQPDIRGRAQPQAAVFEMAGAPPMPNAYPQQGGYDDGYGPQEDQYNEPADQGYVSYNEPPSNNYPPPRSASAAPRANAGFGGLPSGPRPGGLPNGPSPNGGPPRAMTMPRQPSANGDALPSHPPPVRAGLIPNSVASLASNKPTPVRNYNNIPTPQQAQPPPAQSTTQPAPTGPPAPTPVTAAEIEQLRSKAKMNPQDQATQLLLARKLVEASETLVQSIPDQRSRNKAREKFVMDAHKILKKLVSAGNAEAMFFLADCSGRGALGLEVDHKEAFTLYQSAAKAGHAAAAYRTAVCCELGNDEGGGTRKDPLKAIQWYKRAATLGDTPAMYKVGMILLKGLLGQPKNPREAVGWLKRAAERADAENPHALHELGLLFEQPQSAEGSVVRDEAYSLQLFQQAADLGYKFSQYRLGSAYEYGLFNLPIDARQSIMWYSKAAAQEEHQSELALSGWYLTGSEGVLQQSDTEAYLWARKAAMAGLAKAEYAMGYFTEVGIGAPANLEDAKRWYWRAAAQNFPKARERLEDLKRGGKNGALKARERISRSKVGKQNEGECAVM